MACLKSTVTNSRCVKARQLECRLNNTRAHRIIIPMIVTKYLIRTAIVTIVFTGNISEVSPPLNNGNGAATSAFSLGSIIYKAQFKSRIVFQ